MANQNETARATVILNGQQANATLKDLEAAARALNSEIRKLPVNSSEFTKKTEEFQKVKSRISEVKNEINGTAGAMSKMADAANKYFQLITMVGAALYGVGASIVGLLQGNAKLEDSLADIQRTSGMTADQVRTLNKEFGKLDTRTSRQELRDMAYVAGQLGIATDQIFGFVNAVDKMNIALGDEIQGGAQEVARSMGTLRNVLTDMRTTNVAGDMLRIGNAINALGAAGFATAPQLVDFGSRIGGVGVNLGLTCDEVLGLSATLAELGVNTERGGTAVVKILQKMTTNTVEFAKVAGMPMKEFSDLVNNDLYGALIKVMQGSKLSGDSAIALGKIIKDMEISGVGASEVFAKMGNNTVMLAEKTALAGKALQGTDSIMNEFNIKNATLGATLDKLGKAFYGLITMPKVTQFFKDVAGSALELVGWFKQLPQTIEKYSVSLTLLTGLTLAWIAAKTRSLQVAIYNNLTLKEGILLKAKDAIVLEYLIVKEQLYTIWKGNGTIATKAAATAQLLWNEAMKANPIGLLITAVTALVVAVKAYDKYNSDAITLEKMKAGVTILLANANKKLEDSYNKLESQIRSLNQLSAQEKKDLQDKLALTVKSAEAELLLMEAKQKAIGKQAAKPTLWQTGQLFVSDQSKLDENFAYYSWKNQQQAMEPFNEGITTLRNNLGKLKDEKQQLDQILYAEDFGDKITAKSFDALELKLSKYQTALRATEAGTEDFIRIQNKIKGVMKDLSQFDRSDPTVDTSKAKDSAKYMTGILQALMDVRARLLQSELDRELAMEEAALAEKLSKITGNTKAEAELRRLLTEESANKLNAIGKKYADNDFREAYNLERQIKEAKLALMDEYSPQYLTQVLEMLDAEMQLQLRNADLTEQQKAKIREIYALKETKASGDFIDKGQNKDIKFDEELAGLQLKCESDLARGKEKIALEVQEKYRKILTDNVNDEAKINRIKEQMAAETAARIAEYSRKSYEKLAQDILGLAGSAITQLQSLNQVRTDQENAALQRDEDANNKKKENYQWQLSNKLISQKQYDDKVKAMDDELDRKKRKLAYDQARRNKQIALAQGIINVAQAVTSALTGGPLIGIILSILTAALGAAQVAIIAGTDIPQAAKGRYNVIGQEDGKAYDNVPFEQSPQTGIYSSPLLISETGAEMVIDPKTTKKLITYYPQVIQAINYARTPQASAGRYFEPSSNTGQFSFMDPQLVSTMQKLNDHLEKGIVSYISYQHLQDELKKVNSIETDVSNQ